MKRTIKGIKANEMIFNGEQAEMIDYMTDSTGWTCEITITVLQYNGRTYRIEIDRHDRKILREI